MGGHSGKYDRAICYFAPVPIDGTTLPVEKGFYTGPTIHLISSVLRPDPQIADLWAQVEARWKSFTGDRTAIDAHIHDNYTGWFIGDPAIDDKQSLINWVIDSIAVRSSQIVKLSPLSTVIDGNFAVIHYSYIWTYTDINNNRFREVGRYSETLRKEGEKWLLLSDSGGPL